MTETSAEIRNGALRNVPVDLRVCVGRARPTISELLNMERDAILPLDSRIEDEVEVIVGDRLVATGELVELEGDQAGQLAVRVTKVVDPGNAD
ncbi:FliM/FliN family flagellar motor C-terminal domain-containing protein [Fontisubflavum oceani]|uniref:FliM/FliN family flagellar motor C-terminal domain-containing protein n=1 Tax=Fontisubflavum oceani TaxID=2978973 RepID=UPI0025B5537C|nr:FliM/FliN family flagellar motor C-terminal domain-containing protein [Fontisubflavum oceani]WJY22731.1 FliM/FliN family flagellar motor C-terminal domain-containing protein [Fontisubflavum oceani]